MKEIRKLIKSLGTLRLLGNLKIILNLMLDEIDKKSSGGSSTSQVLELKNQLHGTYDSNVSSGRGYFTFLYFTEELTDETIEFIISLALHKEKEFLAMYLSEIVSYGDSEDEGEYIRYEIEYAEDGYEVDEEKIRKDLRDLFPKVNNFSKPLTLSLGSRLDLPSR